ncbi:MAG: hypothetical protein JWP57_740 [Spirosoma sp.]|nr:hypothetical protein [Spirosoma sp.]
MDQGGREQLIVFLEGAGYENVRNVDDIIFAVYALGNIGISVGASTAWLLYNGQLDARLYGNDAIIIEIIKIYMTRDGLIR